MAAQIVATEAVGDLAEQNERLQELVGARVGEAQARGALAARRDRAVDALEVSSASMQSWLKRSISSSRRLAAKPTSRSLARLYRRLPMPKS
jgi:hypothetical protein